MIFRYSAIACGTLSAVIVVGQMTMFWRNVNLSILSYFFQTDLGVFWTQLLCVLPLSYMAVTAYWSIFRLKIAGWYGLYSNHNTDAGSLLWCSYNMARLALPLCYHFLLLIDRNTPPFQTSFQDFMGQMNYVPILGHGINQIFPCVVAIVILCNVTRVYSRAVQCLGLASLEFEFSPTMDCDDPQAEGKALIDRERRRRDEAAAQQLARIHESSSFPGAVPFRSA